MSPRYRYVLFFVNTGCSVIKIVACHKKDTEFDSGSPKEVQKI